MHTPILRTPPPASAPSPKKCAANGQTITARNKKVPSSTSCSLPLLTETAHVKRAVTKKNTWKYVQQRGRRLRPPRNLGCARLLSPRLPLWSPPSPTHSSVFTLNSSLDFVPVDDVPRVLFIIVAGLLPSILSPAGPSSWDTCMHRT